MDIRIIDADIETYKEIFCICILDDKDQWHIFEISRRRNDLYSLVKFINDNLDAYTSYFNGLVFDGQVIEYILRTYEKWIDKSAEEIVTMIQVFASDVIDATNNELRPPYREDQISFKMIDVFEIPHFSNKNRRTSLKWLEFMMDAENIEETPVDFDKIGLTDQDMDDVINYCKTDVYEAKRWRRYLQGEVEHAFYKDKNKIQDRLDMIAEGLLPAKAINYSDSKIGDELNKISYCKLTGKTTKDLYDLKKNRGGTKKFTFGDAIPKYVKFKTKELTDFYNTLKKIPVGLSITDKQAFPVTFKGTTYSIMRGGIHSTEKTRVIRPTENEILMDADVGSQYPNSILKRKLFPVHLGIKWNEVGAENITKKDYYKQLGKKVETKAEKAKAKGLEGMYKLALNSGYFGKTIDPLNWQYGPEVGFYCTIGNQFEILMLIEMLELAGIHCVSANTDGIVCLFNKTMLDTYYLVCNQWEKIVGNDVMGKLEYTQYKILAQESINHYVAVDTDGKVKVKGRFDTEGELNKNNTDKIGRIERNAIVKYFTEGIPIEKTIKESKDIFKFVFGLKSSRNYHFQTIKDNKFTDHKHVIRFFISNEGDKLIKVKNENADTDGPDISKISSEAYVTMCTRMFHPEKFEDYNINYDFYINRATELVRKIEKPRKNKNFKPAPKEQLTMF